MAQCNKKALAIMKAFVKGIDKHGSKSALDVACGSGRVTEGLLLGLYDEVDMFDQCPKAVACAMALSHK